MNEIIKEISQRYLDQNKHNEVGNLLIKEDINRLIRIIKILQVEKQILLERLEDKLTHSVKQIISSEINRCYELVSEPDIEYFGWFDDILKIHLVQFKLIGIKNGKFCFFDNKGAFAWDKIDVVYDKDGINLYLLEKEKNLTHEYNDRLDKHISSLVDRYNRERKKHKERIDIFRD